MGEKPNKTTSLRPLSSKTSFFIRKPVALPQSPKSTEQLVVHSDEASQENPPKKPKYEEENGEPKENWNNKKSPKEEIDLISSEVDDVSINTVGDEDFAGKSVGRKAEKSKEKDEDEEFFKNLSPEVQTLYRQTQAALAQKGQEDEVEIVNPTYKIRFKVENRTKSEQYSESSIPLEINNNEPFKNLISQASRFIGVAPAHLELCSVEGSRIPPTLTPDQCRLVEGNIILHLLDRMGFEQRNKRISKEQKERIEKSKSEEPLNPNDSSTSLIERIPSKTGTLLQIRERDGTLTQIEIDPGIPLVKQILEKFGVKDGRVIFDGQRLAPLATAKALGLEDDDMLDFIQS